jgi:uncharacterized protein (DUF488 family)
MDSVSVMAVALYTVGYEGREVDELLEMLLAAGVTRLVDVRELPLSRKRGLSKTALGNSLNDIGIAYEHAKPLGNPKENRERYWSGDVEGGAEIYRRHLHNGSYSTLVDLAESLDDGTACLLCFERDHEVCHREVIVDSLRELRPGLAVDHL